MWRRSPELLDRQRSRLLVIDMQERLLSVIPNAVSVTARCEQLLRGSQILGVPTSATEQYPEKLGSTVSPLVELLGERPAKLRFSCADALEWSQNCPGPADRDQVVLAGIETHVCVLQTACDLLAAGFRVYLATDAMASRSEQDRRMALDRLAAAGATLTTTESILFEWCEVAGTPEFKQISRLIK